MVLNTMLLKKGKRTQRVLQCTNDKKVNVQSTDCKYKIDQKQFCGTPQWAPFLPTV